MNIKITWHGNQFNVALANQDKDPFIEIKGCRIVSGEKGEFIGWPSTKNENTQKYWNHVYASKEFSSVVLKKAKESQPIAEKKEKTAFDDMDSDIPF